MLYIDIRLATADETDLGAWPIAEKVEDGKSGNRVLNTNCHYCPFKHKCWGDANGGNGLRGFRYATGVKYFTHVAKQPNVDEVFVEETD